MGWKSRPAKEGSEPERQAWEILDEMGLKYDHNQDISTPFRDFPIEADLLVEDCLVVEVQSVAFHVAIKRHGKWKPRTTQMRKDKAKLECFEAMGFGCLWIYDDELRYAFQKKRGPLWRPAIKEWILTMLDYSKKLRVRYIEYMSFAINTPMGPHPEYGQVSLKGDERRQ